MLCWKGAAACVKRHGREIDWYPETSMSLWAKANKNYHATKKKQDINWWTEWVCRPLASFVVVCLMPTRVTPNQVTIMSFLVALVSASMLVLLPSWSGGIVAALVFEASFVLDCADGQLARARETPSPLGHHFDFLLDEIKAFLIYAAITVRLYQS